METRLMSCGLSSALRLIFGWCILCRSMPSANGLSDQAPIVRGPRPLQMAADILEARFGWRISYEDPVIVYAGDLVDTGPEYGQAVGDRRLMGMRRGELNLGPALSAGVTDAKTVLEGLAAATEVNQNIASFRVLQDGDTFHVVPAKVRDSSGKIVVYKPLLDTKIVVPAGRRRLGEMIRLICDNVAKVSGVNLTLNEMSLDGGSDQFDFPLRADTARNLLLRALDASGSGVRTWWLLCDPGVGVCVLNVRHVEVEVELPNGSRARRPL